MSAAKKGQSVRRDADRATGSTAKEQTTDYTRCGGHVLTDMGWMVEDQVERSGATKSEV